MNPKSVPMPLASFRYSFTFGLLSAMSLFLLSAFLSSQNPLVPVETEEEWESNERELSLLTPSIHASPVAVPGADQEIEITLLRKDDSVDTMSLSDYLWGVVAAEMPASFPLEALKAQAVAARTYTGLRLSQGKHENALLCDNSGCCQAYVDVADRLASWGTDAPFYQESIQKAISETEGLYVLYEGSPIDAVFFSSSSGQTLEAQEVWGSALPYLQSVESPEGEDVPNYHSQVVYTSEEFAQLLEQKYPAVDLSASADTWVTDFVADSGGGTLQMTLGGVTLSGGQIRALYGLRSTHFSLDYDAGLFTFAVTGYGHGVGMSQYGAKTMAEQGKRFDQILTWYYTDCQVKFLGDL